MRTSPLCFRKHNGSFGRQFPVMFLEAQRIEPDKKTVGATSALTTSDLTRKGGPIRYDLSGMDKGKSYAARAKSRCGCTSKPIAGSHKLREPSNIPHPRALVRA